MRLIVELLHELVQKYDLNRDKNSHRKGVVWKKIHE